jgi:HAMP domain-containing protein
LDLLQNFYLNYYTIGVITGFFMTGLIALFLSLLPSKSTPTKYLILIYFTGALLTIGYILVQGIYFPTKWIRVYLLIAITLNHLFTIQLFFHFPTNTHPRLAKWFLYIQGFIFLVLDIFVIIKSYGVGVVYDFGGHYYEVDSPIALKIYGLVVLLNIFVITIVGVWKTVITPKKERMALIFINIGVFCTLFIPGFVNVLNKSGIVSRTVYISLFCLFTIIGLFMVIVSYINKTSDKTTFMFKIVGVSFVSFMVVYNVFSYIVMNEMENTYDLLHRGQSTLAMEANHKPDDLKYIIEYDPENDISKFTHNTDNIELPKYYKYELINSYIYNTYSKTKDASLMELKQTMQNLKIKDNEYASGYTSLIQNYLDKHDPGSEISNANVNDFIHSKDRFLFYRYNKINQMSNDNFKKELQDFLNKEKEDFLPFKEAIQKHLDSTDKDNQELKLEILNFVIPMQDIAIRRYRKSLDEKNHFVIFHYVDSEKNKVYELGYSYLDYRKFIHSIGLKLVYILFFALILVVIGTPIFLSGTLINPLNALLEGLGKVKKGNLDITIPVKVQDEIGFLSNSFNSMVKSIKDSKDKLEDYAEHLEEKVEARTKELQVTLNQVEKLKTQQDGDYFLTTLLLRPLGVNKVLGSKVKVDFFVKQKKEFKFKSVSHDIGGDICITHQIKLKGRDYITFLNADAMGKSMQGAGGVLVLGAVFQSIIQRTVSYSAHSEVPPEFWIKSAFKEMHKIFESFDGSMLISLVFGLVDERSGLVYFINAEHPWVILYRDGVADFIEHDMKFRKLGTSGLENELCVSTFQMMAGDFLIIGSDGKDDLILSKDEKKDTRVINEDEGLFLKRVEEAKGDLNKIFQLITDKFELMDDFSLLSISYPDDVIDISEEETKKIEDTLRLARTLVGKHNFKDAITLLQERYEENKDRSEVAQYLIKAYMKERNYKEASKICKEFLEKNELDTALLFKASYCLKMNHEFKEAIEMAERIKLRDPYNIRNLIHLADMYAYTKNFKRSQKLVKKVLHIEPENKGALKILERLEQETVAS